MTDQIGNTDANIERQKTDETPSGDSDFNPLLNSKISTPDVGADGRYDRYGESVEICDLTTARQRIEELETEVRRLKRALSVATSMKGDEMENGGSGSLATGIMEAAFDAMFFVDEDGIIHRVNNTAVSQFGWSQDELIGNNISMIMQGTAGGNHNTYLQNCLKADNDEMEKKRELTAIRKDESEFPVELGVTEVKTDLDKRMLCVFVRDLTRQKKDEQELIQKESLTMGIIDAAFDAMFYIDESGVIHMVNDAAVAQFGWCREELIGSKINMIMQGDHTVNHDKYLQRFLKTGERRVMGKQRELPAKRKDGTSLRIELGLSEVKTEWGDKRMFCGFVRDVTQQKEYELELIRKQSLTMGIIEAAFDAMFNIDENGIIYMVNGAAVSQFGWSREEFIGRNINMIMLGNHARNHDKYMLRYLKTGEKRVMGKKRELSARRKDGSEFPIELGLTEVKTDSGDKRMFCGFVRDLTRQTEDKIELIRKHSLTMGIIEASFDAMFAIDEYGIIQMVNGASTTRFGWSRKEFLGQNIKMIVDAKHTNKHDEYIRRYLETGIKKMIGKQRELIALRKDGSTFPIILGLSEIAERRGSSPLFVAFIRDLTEEKKIEDMANEKAAAEALLLNMLPEDIAKRLKDDPSNIAKHFSRTTILFADIIGFTALSSVMPPVEVVNMLNDLFGRFDDLVEKYDLNKVKTIGDCYMVTSVPSEDQQDDDCSRVCHFGLDMIEALNSYNDEHPHTNLNLRVGINTGPVVAGVVGTKRFLYDLWGDAVNLASKMESTGIPGKIQVTGDIVNRVGDDFNFESRGLTTVKGEGEVETFILLERNKPRPPQVPISQREGSRRSPKMSLVDSLKQFKGSTVMEAVKEQLHELQALYKDEEKVEAENQISANEDEQNEVGDNQDEEKQNKEEKGEEE